MDRSLCEMFWREMSFVGEKMGRDLLVFEDRVVFVDEGNHSKCLPNAYITMPT